ncbi:MAG: MmcQ/YjbR family DNA-binding protein [Solirubrobacterales bacterium]|nr:MmcQ/YjbR family DNA-binding protein [Solirubrobacterales bacterium]
MACWEDVRRIALGLPETTEGTAWGNASWRVRGKQFVWERPLGQADLRALGDGAPEGPILGARVEQVGAKEALLADDPGVYFTTPHFDGYPAILVRLDEIDVYDLEEVVVEAWLVQAPRRLAREWQAARDQGQAPSDRGPA